MYEKILVPLDTSGLAEQVVPPAAELAGALNSEVHLINVCEPGDDERGQACRSYLLEAAERLKGLLAGTRAKVVTELIDGVTDRKILEYATMKQISLVMMTSHGRSGVMPWPMGSTADKVIRKTGVPLMAVRARPEQPGDASLFRRIVVPLDGSERGAAALPYAIVIANRLASEISMLHVVEMTKHIEHAVGGRLEDTLYREVDVTAEMKQAKEYLEKQRARFGDAESRVSTEVVSGDAASEIIKFANARDASLIAMSSHGHSGIEVFVIGSVTNKVLAASRRSVFFVPAVEG